MRGQIGRRLAALYAWLCALRLPPWPATLLGAGVGALVGLAMVKTMVDHQVFTQPHQDVTAGALVLLIWTAIGAVSGLTVLAPEDEADGPKTGP
ncbi:MAG: hypothetical protein C4290_04970 [Chloroflexota bacterium]